MRGDLARVLGWLRPQRRRMGAATALQVATVLAGVSLMGTSAWLISAAALHPSIAELQLAIVGVRCFGLARGGLRYGERLLSHDVTLRLLARLRTRIYAALEPRAPAGLLNHRGGDILARLVGDVDTLENLYVRLLGPTLAALLVAGAVGVFLGRHHPALGVAAVAGLALGGMLLPWVAWRLGARPGRAS